MQFKPKKSLGQNFLLDRNIRAKIISACGLSKDDLVLEIGAGRGELTRDLAQCEVKKIYAIEIDRRIIETLQKNLTDRANVEVVHQDILRFDPAGIFRKYKKKFKVIGNVPYYITTAIIERLFSWRANLQDIYLTVQKEYAQRVCAHAGSAAYGALSCFIRYYAAPKIIFFIKKNSFVPAPKVDSAFLRLTIHDTAFLKPEDERRLFRIIRAAFNQRRKTLKNSLSGTVSPGQLERFFLQYKINPKIRPEDLSLEEFMALARVSSQYLSALPAESRRGRRATK